MSEKNSKDLDMVERNILILLVERHIEGLVYAGINIDTYIKILDKLKGGE